MVGVISGRFGLVATPIQTDADGRPIVRGEDQLFSYRDTLHLPYTNTLEIDDGALATASPPADEVWVVTNVVAVDGTTAPTAMYFRVYWNVNFIEFHYEEKAFAIGERSCWGGKVVLKAGETIQAHFLGGLHGDTCFLWITGYRMTLES